MLKQASALQARHESPPEPSLPLLTRHTVAEDVGAAKRMTKTRQIRLVVACELRRRLLTAAGRARTVTTLREARSRPIVLLWQRQDADARYATKDGQTVPTTVKSKLLSARAARGEKRHVLHWQQLQRWLRHVAHTKEGCVIRDAAARFQPLGRCAAEPRI